MFTIRIATTPEHSDSARSMKTIHIHYIGLKGIYCMAVRNLKFRGGGAVRGSEGHPAAADDLA